MKIFLNSIRCHIWIKQWLFNAWVIDFLVIFVHFLSINWHSIIVVEAKFRCIDHSAVVCINSRGVIVKFIIIKTNRPRKWHVAVLTLWKLDSAFKVIRVIIYNHSFTETWGGLQFSDGWDKVLIQNLLRSLQRFLVSFNILIKVICFTELHFIEVLENCSVGVDWKNLILASIITLFELDVLFFISVFDNYVL